MAGLPSSARIRRKKIRGRRTHAGASCRWHAPVVAFSPFPLFVMLGHAVGPGMLGCRGQLARRGPAVVGWRLKEGAGQPLRTNVAIPWTGNGCGESADRCSMRLHMMLRRLPLLVVCLVLSGCLQFGPNVTTTAPSIEQVRRGRAARWGGSWRRRSICTHSSSRSALCWSCTTGQMTAGGRYNVRKGAEGRPTRVTKGESHARRVERGCAVAFSRGPVPGPRLGPVGRHGASMFSGNRGGDGEGTLARRKSGSAAAPSPLRGANAALFAAN